MNEELEQDILARLRQVGHSGEGLSGQKWKQLAALHDAARLMNLRSREAYAVLKANALTASNAERVLKEIGGITFTDATMHNNNRLLEKFLLTFEEADMSKTDARRENKKLKEQVVRLENKIKKMELRDAECEDALLKLAELERYNADLIQDKKDLEARLDKVGTKQKVVPMLQLDLTKSTNKTS